MNSAVVLRVRRRGAAWESGQVEQIMAADFTTKDGSPDLRPSVYLLPVDSPDQRRNVCLRAKAEHCAAHLSPPPKNGAADIDLAGLVEDKLVMKENESPFTFTRTTHAEVSLGSVEELRELISRVLPELTKRLVTFERLELLRYMAERWDSGDEEWLRRLGSRLAPTNWGKAVLKVR